MPTIDFDEAIRLHNTWRRQFMNAFAQGSSYADMPLSGHRGCQLGSLLTRATGPCTALPQFGELKAVHERFHAIANEIMELAANGLASSADLMLPELSDQSHRLANLFDELRSAQRDSAG